MLQFKHVIILIIIISILVLLSFYSGYKFAPQKDVAERVDTVILYDTIIIQEDPVIINRTRTRVKYLKDTIIQTKPFQAMLDTIIKKDTIKAMYEFPEHLFSLELRRGKDTIPVRKVIITETKYKEVGRNWYEIPLYIASGFVVGYISRGK